MAGESDRGRELLTEARARELLFGVCGGRLWVHVSGEHAELAHLATTLLVHEAEVLAALADEQGAASGEEGGCDHDQPFRFGAPAPFSPGELARLQSVRARYASRPPDGEHPAGG